MRGIIREWFLYILSVYLLDKAFSFISIANTAILISSGTALYLLHTVGKPILKILWLPINIITLGMFSWVLNIIVIVLVTLFVPGFRLENFSLPSYQIGKVFLPNFSLNMVWTYLLFSLFLAQTVGFLYWLLIEGE